MSAQKPSLPQGTRDFGPAVMAKRLYILHIIEEVFRRFGFSRIETPAMENLSVLTGKYGDEGDQLIYKILNSGDYMKGLTDADLKDAPAKLAHKLCDKALRYDLTVPFARFVVMNRNDLTFPFKRYQIQPVWRGDRPQKGRYREFYQCDADVVGTESLLCEAEILWMLTEVLGKLGVQDYTIKLNHRAVLEGMAEAIGEPGKEGIICVAIDKLDKIGTAGVEKELADKGISTCAIGELMPMLEVKGDNKEIIQRFKYILQKSEAAQRGLSELEQVLAMAAALPVDTAKVQLDLSLARGLSYYTGCIFETKVNNVSIGSISGGGRYDNLTGVFGMPDVSGVGFSFGIDRLYDVLDELQLFPTSATQGTHVLLAAMDDAAFTHALSILAKLRVAGIAAELYPSPAKLKKQLGYANDKNIPYAVVIGDEEIKKGIYSLKNMITGEQTPVSTDELVTQLS